VTERPWESEPDSLDFEADGLPCVMRRNTNFGTWCGYVGIDREHPLFDLPTNHPLKLPASWFEGRRPLEGASPFDLFMHIVSGATSIDDACPISLAFQVHGGVNYSEDHVPGLTPDGRWWFGFDCGHAGDYMPGNENITKIMDELVDSMPDEARDTMRRIVSGEKKVYRDQQYVVSECQSLAAQLNAVVGVITKERTDGHTADRRD
jgi:hypothetical protein